MDPNNIILLLQTYGYPLMFFLMYIEGPIVTFISAFLSTLGIFFLPFVWVLCFFGDFLGDITHFFAGNKGFNFIKNKIKKGGLTEDILYSLRKMIHQNLFYSLFLIKLSPPPISSAGLFLIGTLKEKRKKAIIFSALISLMIESVFISLGLFSGKYFKIILGSFNKYYLIAMILCAGIIIYFVSIKIIRILIKNKLNSK